MPVLRDDCKTAALQLIGQIQGYGALFRFDRNSGLITACSENVGCFLGNEPEDLLGRHWEGPIKPEYVDVDHLASDTGAAVIPNIINGVLNGNPVVVSSHNSGSDVIVEVEPLSEDPRHTQSERLSFLQKLSVCDRISGAAILLMNQVAAITGFDRVMLYRFLPGWHGKVIAECNKPGVRGYLDLHFPASDIPENARRLYTVNIQRCIADTDGPVVDIQTAAGAQEPDLTHAQLRAVHPVHLQYLKNIGARASFSVSIIVSGRLWGMVACHHMQPKILSFRQRYLCDELARILSLHMSGLMSVEQEKHRSVFSVTLSQIQEGLKTGESLLEGLRSISGQLLSSFRANGMWLRLDKSDQYHGNMPWKKIQPVLDRWVQGLDREHVFATDQAPSVLTQHPELVSYVAGVLFIPFNQEGFIAFLRKEQVEEVRWAGRSDSSTGDSGQMNEFTPRASFAAWTEQVRGCSIPWRDAELDAAEQLRGQLGDFLEKYRLEKMALQDELTGLANRRLFEQKLQEAMQISREHGSIVAVMMLDLDLFKEVNDTYGHPAGDDLLKQVARRLLGLVRARDTVARLGGDEFAVILYHVNQLEEVETVAGRIVGEIQKPFKLEEADVHIGASLGISLYPGHAENREDLIERADLALYGVKRKGRNAYSFYSQDMKNPG